MLNFLVAGGLFAILGFAWYLSAEMTGLHDSVANVSVQVAASSATASKEFTQQLDALGMRVTNLETARNTTDHQLSDTAASIAGLRAQTAAMQGTIQDMSQGIRAIQSDISSIARVANTPLPRSPK